MSSSSVFPTWVFYSISTTSKEACLEIITSLFSEPSVENTCTKKICFLSVSMSLILEKFYVFHAERKKIRTSVSAGVCFG